jgi:hypothetical protein
LPVTPSGSAYISIPQNYYNLNSDHFSHINPDKKECLGNNTDEKRDERDMRKELRSQRKRKRSNQLRQSGLSKEEMEREISRLRKCKIVVKKNRKKEWME